MPAAIYQGAAHTASVALPLVFEGEERLDAHRALVVSLGEPGRAPTAKEQAEAELLVERDPSLFVEAIPELSKSDKFWYPLQTARAWWGTWAACAGTNGNIEIIKALLERGVDPNDRSVFRQPLLQLPCWHRHPDRVRLLLANGADPDCSVTPVTGESDPGRSVTRDVLSWMRGLLAPAACDYEGLRSGIDVVGQLVAAGARNFDGGPAVIRYGDSAIRMLTEHFELVPPSRPESEALRELAARLVSAGADVNLPSGRLQYSPVVVAVKNKAMRSLQLLLELGADVADERIARPAVGDLRPEVVPLPLEARAAGGPEFEAQVRAMVTDALMSKVIGSTNASPGSESAPRPAQRRRMV